MILKHTENNPLAVKDVDMKSRTVTGYFSVFGNKDSDEDIINKGAYTKTISDRGDRIKHLFMHNPTLGIIGSISELKEDDYGLFFKSTLLDTALGTDVLKMYDAGVLKEHSVGFETIRESKANDGINHIEEIRLWEGSSVVWGSNELARVSKTFSWMNYNGSDINLLETLKAQVDELQDSLSKLAGTTTSEEAGPSLLEQYLNINKN